MVICDDKGQFINLNYVEYFKEEPGLRDIRIRSSSGVVTILVFDSMERRDIMLDEIEGYFHVVRLSDRNEILSNRPPIDFDNRGREN